MFRQGFLVGTWSHFISKLASEFNTFKENQQYGCAISQSEYNEIYMKFKRAQEDISYLKEELKNK